MRTKIQKNTLLEGHRRKKSIGVIVLLGLFFGIFISLASATTSAPFAIKFTDLSIPTMYNFSAANLSKLNDSNFNTNITNFTTHATCVNFDYANFTTLPENASNVAIILDAGCLPGSNCYNDAPYTDLKFKNSTGGYAGFNLLDRINAIRANHTMKAPYGIKKALNTSQTLDIIGVPSTCSIYTGNLQSIVLTELWLNYTTDNTPPTVSTNFSTLNNTNILIRHSSNLNYIFWINNSDDQMLGTFCGDTQYPCSQYTAAFYNLNSNFSNFYQFAHIPNIPTNQYNPNNNVPYAKNIGSLPLGQNNISFIVFNDAGANATTPTYFFNLLAYGYTQNSISYTPITTEGNVENFSINMSYDSTYYPNVAGYLLYNGTRYAASRTGSGTNTIFSKSLTIPNVAATQNVSFYWSFDLINSSGTTDIYNSSTYNQTIQNFVIDNCTTYTTLLLNYTLKDEQTQTVLNGPASNASIEVAVNIYPLTSSTAVATFSQLYGNASNAAVCINSSLVNANYYLDATAKYSATDYQTEYNVQRSTALTSTNLAQNISLLILPTSVSTTFQIIFKDTSFLAVGNAVIDIARQYISENTFKTVERPITDIDGKTTASLIKDTGIYNIYVYTSGQLVATYLNVIPVCQTPAITDCKIELNQFSSSVDVTNFSQDDDFLFTLTNSRDDRTTISTFTIPSGSVATIVLNVTTTDALGTTVCTQSATTSAGSLTCTYDASLGNGTLIAKLYRNNELVAQGQVSLEQSPSDIYGGMLVMLGLFILLTLIGASLSDNPVYTVIFFLVGVILLFALNLVAHNGFIGTGATILFLVIAIILIIIKGSKRV